MTFLISEDVRRLLEQADWEKITLTLAAHALSKIRRLRWRSGDWERLPGGAMAEDFVHEAVALLLSGDRKWDPSTCPDLVTWLRGVIDSLVSHLVKSKEHRMLQPIPQTEEGQDMGELLRLADPADKTAVHLVSIQTDHGTRLAEREAAERLVHALFEEISGDQELETLLESLMDGCEKPSEIADRTGMDVARVYKLREKLDRATRRVEGTTRP